MTPDEHLQAQKAALTEAMGSCIVAWSMVEAKLASIFVFTLGVSPTIADAILATPRAFEVRSLIIHNVLRIRLADQPLLDDWNLIYAFICKMGRKRNEVAHALMLNVEGKAMMLEPFFMMTQPKEHISIDQVRERTASFIEVQHCLWWLEGQMIEPLPQSPEKSFLLPIPDLLLRLRREDAQRREEQRARQKSSDRK